MKIISIVIKKIGSWIIKHKIIAICFILIIATAIFLGYQRYFNVAKTTTTYTTEAVQKGMLINSISGTGQILASNQVDIKPNVSGIITAIAIEKGQTLKQGDPLVQIDDRDAIYSLNDAQANLELAKLDLENLMAPADDLTLSQAEYDLVNANDDLEKLKLTQQNDYQTLLDDIQNSNDTIQTSYDDSYNIISNVFLDLPDIMADLDDSLFSKTISQSEIAGGTWENVSTLINTANDNDRMTIKTYAKIATNDYQTARDAYDENLADYKNLNRDYEPAEIETLLDTTYTTNKLISAAIKSEINLYDYWVDLRKQDDLPVFNSVTNYQTLLNQNTSTINKHLTDLLSSQRAIEDAINKKTELKRQQEETDLANPLAIAKAERQVETLKAKLADLQKGPDEYEIKSKQLNIRQRENSLVEAQQNLDDHYIVAPFDGIVAETDIAIGESASSGTVICTYITDKKLAEITLNEIDVAKVKTGQKATITFDAVPDLSITGEVAEIDILGTVTQGVVSYNVKIAFDVQDERIKPGMSLSASIITEAKANVLMVPVNAVKTSGETSYVELLVDNQPQRQAVTVGSSNDTMTEIINGLQEGQAVITQTISAATTSQRSSTQNNQSMPGVMRLMR